jgi:hypothetical protein
MRYILSILLFCVLSSCEKDPIVKTVLDNYVTRYLELKRLGKYVMNSPQNYYYEFKENGQYIYGSNTSSYLGVYRMIDHYTLEFYIQNHFTYTSKFDSLFSKFETEGYTFYRQ